MKVEVELALHGSKESNREDGKELGLKGEALSRFCYALYEVIFKLEVDTETGDYKILTVDGKRLIEE